MNMQRRDLESVIKEEAGNQDVTKERKCFRKEGKAPNAAERSSRT